MRRRVAVTPGAPVLVLVGLLAAPRAFALGPLETNQPQVAEGLKAYDAGRYEDALRAFDAARAQLPDSAALEYDRGNALYRLKRLDEAQKAYQRAAELAPGQLKAKDLYNLGNTLADLGHTDEAIAAYKQALLLEPGDEAARHNLELLRRRKTPPKSGGRKGSPDAGQDAGAPDAGQDAGPPDAGRPDGGQGDGGTGDAGTSDAGNQDRSGQGDGGPGDAGPGDAGSGSGRASGDAGQRPEPKPEPDQGQTGNRAEDAGVSPQEADGGMVDLRDGGTAEAGPLERKDTERLLDALRQNEKNLQLWRFQQKNKQRKPNEKDW